MKKDFVKNQYVKEVDDLFSNLSGFSFDSYLSNVYDKKVPNYFKKYLKPEKKHVESLASELNGYFEGIQNNLYENIRNNPRGAMKTSLENLLFGNAENKEVFSTKISETVEELSYATNVLAAEGYKIWNVKYNTPGVGRIARGKLKKLIGEEDLPEFDETKKKIEKLKESTYLFLDYVGFDSEKKISVEDVGNRYQERMKSYGDFTDSRRLLVYDLDSELYEPKNAKQKKEIFDESVKVEWISNRGSKLEEMTESERNVDFERFNRRKEKQRQREFIGSNYNSWWEKLIGYVGLIFNF